MCRRVAIAAVIVVVLGSRTFAWWNSGHSYIAEQAVQHLPAALQTFVNRNFATIDYYASGEPPGRHYIDIDLYPEFHAGQMPRDLDVLYATHGQQVVDSRGISPWKIETYRETLTAQMSTARELSDLLAVAQTAGEMAHYLQDINQPLHTTDNHNGQYNNNANLGIHARYEGEMIEPHFADLPIVAAPLNCVYIADTVDWVLDSIETRTWAYVDDIMAADTLASTYGPPSSDSYFNSLWNSTGAFTHSQFQYATEMVASAWYSAWVDAGSPALSISGDYNNDGTVGGADYVVWRNQLNTPAHLPNDLTQGVGAGDYNEWRLHFGQTSIGAGSLLFESAIPEPSTILLLLGSVLVIGIRRGLCR